MRALSPRLTESDRRTVEQIRKLVGFLLGDFEGALDDDGAVRPEHGTDFNILRLQTAARRILAAPGIGGGGGRGRGGGASAGNDRLRKLIPVAREYAPQLRDYGALLLVRLGEKTASRGLNWLEGRLTGGSGGGGGGGAAAARATATGR